MESESASSVKSTSFSGRSLLSRKTMSSAASSADPRFRKTPVAPQPIAEFVTIYFGTSSVLVNSNCTIFYIFRYILQLYERKMLI
ncbi:unnamed protein product [Oikopleura dioica]|uniref:Uncharacterized protein n=1 Tax=Oikopleura dioica TaxID=34765 RepID=E4X1H0_OIKDI|nr:unnamed protein product [Oikopleura dioica]CBY30677.1 unnamed protein product [Oikopleura dioica]CBY32014.1 unnamed protein product [Oikopleura dioica]